MDIREEAVQTLVEKAVSLMGLNAEDLGEDTRFKEDLSCTSMNIVQFSAALEEQFDVEVPYMELARKKTFGEAGELMEELLG